MEKTIVWVFGSESEINPFIPLSAESLSKKGYRVILSDLKEKRFPRETVYSFSKTLKETKITNQLGQSPPKTTTNNNQTTINKKKKFTRLRQFLKTIKYIREFADNRILPVVFNIQGKIFDLSVYYSYLSAPLRLAFRSLIIIFKYQPAIVVCSNPIYLIIATIYKRFHGCRLVYYPFELVGEQVKKTSLLEIRVEKKYLMSAIDSLITQNESRANVYEKERRARVKAFIVHNYKKLNPRPPVYSKEEVYQKLSISPDQRLVVYEGHLFSGRNLENLAISLKYLDDNIKMLFIGMGSKSWWAEIMEPLIDREDIHNRLIRIPFTKGDELHAIICAADVGVILYDNSCRNNYFCEPGKLSDYLEAGIPIIVPNYPTIKPIVVGHQIGISLEGNSPKEIANAIIKILAKPRIEWINQMILARETLTWDTQESQLFKAVIGLEAGDW